jgi:hypothetical protein
MVINSNTKTDATSLQQNQTPAKPATRTTTTPAADTSSPATIEASTVSIFAAQTQPSPVSDIMDGTSADQTLGFLKDSFLSQPSLAMTAQANQIPASVLTLLQP